MNRKLSAAALCMATAFVLTLTGSATATVPVGGFRVNPDSVWGGTLFVEGGVPANYSVLVISSTNPFVGDFAGDVTSTVWRDPGTGYLAFEYAFTVDAAISPLRSATIGGDWLATTVFNVGADGSGVSSGDWTDGDPLLLGRLNAAGFGGPNAIYSTLLAPDGTSFFPGQASSVFWYATDALAYTINDFDALDAGLSAESPVYVPGPAGTVPPELPTLSAWGMIVLGILLIGGLATKFDRRIPVTAK